METTTKDTVRMEGKRKMSLNGKSPEATKDQVYTWVKNDVQILCSLVYMINNDEEIIKFIADKFYEKINSPQRDEISQALDAIENQKSQPKKD